MYRGLIFLFSACLFLLPTFSYGQSSAALSVDPMFPEAGEEYKVSIASALMPTDTVRWFIDGKERSEFTDTQSITLEAKGLGVVETISVQIQSGDGTVSRATKKIIPSRVDLIVTANTLTPPFYKGRKLGSAGSDMTATAQVFLGSPKETGALTYVWSVADKVQNGGIASVNNAITFSSGFEDELLVAVTVYKNGVAVAGKSVFVTIAKSEIHFYEKNLLRGLSMVAMKTPHLFIGEELLLRAEPYFVDRDLVSNSIKPAWKINNRTMDGNQDNPYELSLQKQGSAGSAQISFSLQNVAKLLQSVQGSIGVQF